MDVTEKICVAITISIIAICVAFMTYTLALEVQKTNRCAIESGLSKQFNSNVSGWLKI